MKSSTGVEAVKKTLTVLLSLIFIFTFAGTSWAQNAAGGANPADQGAVELPADPTAGKQPAMENVFFNVLWGSFAGGVLYAGVSMLDENTPASEKYSANHLYERFFIGATAGGFLGLAVGVYLSFNNVEFDANRSRIAMEPFAPTYSPVKDPTLYSMSSSPLQPDTIILPLVVTQF